MRIFVTGTDTGCGKTFVAAALTRALRALGRDALAIKPVASGFESIQGARRNADLDTLAAASGGSLAPDALNVYGFEAPIAPHRAAELEGRRIELAPILAAVEVLGARCTDLIVEGVGGHAVPLSSSLMLADLVRALRMPLLLVVGLRLGCINHALLSAAAIRADGLPLLGWIGNRVDPGMQEVRASVDAIAARIGAPLLGVLGHAQAADAVLAQAVLDAWEPTTPAGVHCIFPARTHA